jgi:hypothetical protein
VFFSNETITQGTFSCPFVRCLVMMRYGTL